MLLTNAGMSTLLALLCLPLAASAFNLDTENPLFRLGPPDSWFGFSLAIHFRQKGPSLLVGAPRAESGQPGTSQAGAVFTCDLPIGQIGARHLATTGCSRLAVEYAANATEAMRPSEMLKSRRLHREGKNQQLLGFSVHSTGLREPSRALACAPLLRWELNAYTEGVCYLLGAELNQMGTLNQCASLPKKDRHNDYAACEQGFSAFIDRNVTLTGLPGARKWTGGVFARYEFDSNGFSDSVDRWTMEVDKTQGGILALLASHDYLGYSVRYGRFGFWHEDDDHFTVVSGATRFNQTGAVLFLPFRRNSLAEEQRQLGLTEDRFLLSGRQLGSGFGSSLEVLDLNGDGFDDLLVGAPFEYGLDGVDGHELGGAVYVFFSRGAKQAREASHRVFLEPVVLRGLSAHSQFGSALTRLGNLDNDPHGFQDFCVGAPQGQTGHGEVFLFHGATRADFSSEPAQHIRATDLQAPKPLLAFGAALAGGVDLDGNGYAELAVGVPGADVAVLFLARPVLDVQLGHRFGQKYVNIGDEASRDCDHGQSCFSLTTSLLIFDRNQSARRLLADAFPGGQAPFVCRLEVVPFAKGVPGRALLTSNGDTHISWHCGLGPIGRPEERTFQLHIPKGNQDWTNPLRFNFSLVERRSKQPSRPSPALNPAQKRHLFDISFDKHCGEDNECHTDLALSGTMLDLSRRADGLYQAKVTERDALVLRLLVENRAEQAYLARLYLTYDDTELDEPRLVRHGQTAQPVVDIERRQSGMAVLALGNPLKAGQKLGFDLLFKLVRSSSERISASMHFSAVVNSSSLEAHSEDNHWEADVQLIKEADLQLDGISRPPIVHFSRGNARPDDELDIGPQLVHSFTLTNLGPFYARNVTVKIDWPQRLRSTTSNNSDWLLYVLEEPLIRHEGQFRRCTRNQRAVNPLGVYNDETLKLDYQLRSGRARKPRATDQPPDNDTDAEAGQAATAAVRASSILHPDGPLWPKSIRESSGEWVRVLNINCKDGAAQCVQLVCHFDYIGSNDSALIEVRSRLWNWTFSAVEDYRAFDYVAITSEAFIELDPVQGILEDVSNNFAQVTSHAYPDRPQQQDQIELWLLLLSALIGLVILLLVVLLCKHFGFFRRKRPDLHLHQAHYQREREESFRS